MWACTMVQRVHNGTLVSAEEGAVPWERGVCWGGGGLWECVGGALSVPCHQQGEGALGEGGPLVTER